MLYLGGPHVWTVTRWGRAWAALPTDPIPTRAQERCGGRLPRHAGAGPLSLARGPRRAGLACLDRGREPHHRVVSGADPPAGRDPPAAHAAVELSQIRRPVSQDGAVLLLQERRSAEPIGAVQAGVARGRRGGAAPSGPPVAGRDRC